MNSAKRAIEAATTSVFILGMGLTWAGTHTVNITPSLEKIEVMHEGKPVLIQRNQDQDHVIAAPFNKTSRPCPPFCIQPMHIAPGVETIGELELLSYLKRTSTGDHSVLVIDSRTPDWVARGTIPGSVNIPWNKISVDFTESFDIAAESKDIDNLFEARFGAKPTESGWDFSDAKTLILFCNGAWCAQSPTNIATLLKRGYPANKLKWYRGGLQDWTSFGLTLVTPIR